MHLWGLVKRIIVTRFCKYSRFMCVIYRVYLHIFPARRIYLSVLRMSYIQRVMMQTEGCEGVRTEYYITGDVKKWRWISFPPPPPRELPFVTWRGHENSGGVCVVLCRVCVCECAREINIIFYANTQTILCIDKGNAIIKFVYFVILYFCILNSRSNLPFFVRACSGPF
jgi:hypothetical protein